MEGRSCAKGITYFALCGKNVILTDKKPTLGGADSQVSILIGGSNTDTWVPIAPFQIKYSFPRFCLPPISSAGFDFKVVNLSTFDNVENSKPDLR